jgi:plasmid stabilization system protein ParE
MTYHVRLTATANREAAEALAWMGSHIPDYAVQWDAEFERALDSLTENPERFPLADESDLFERQARYMIVGKRNMKYRAFFEISGDTVTVFHVLHASRDWPPQ